jgi:3-hydroxy-3-methylglutaryl CoA synthase
MIADKWIEWMEKNGDIENIFAEAGNPKSETDKEWIKKVSKSSIYKNFVEQKIAPGEKASSEIGNMYTASIFMSLISSLVEASSNGNEFTNKKIGFISYGSGSKAKIFEGTVQNNWKNKIGRINLFQNLNSRKEISIDIYEQLHKRKVHPI